MKPSYFLLPAFLIGQAYAMTLPESPVRAYECMTCDALSHSTLSSSWRLANEPLEHKSVHEQKSRKYRVFTTLGVLEKGINLPTRAAGAVISISPMNKQLSLVKPIFRIKKNDVELSLSDASSLLTQNQDTHDSEFDVQNQTLFQLKPDLGAGKFILSASKSGANSGDRYVIQVLDQGSTTYLRVETDKSHYQYGDDMTITFRLQDGAYGYPIDNIDATLVSPEGDSLPLTLKRQKWDTYVAHSKMTDEHNSAGKNWYIEADVSTIIGEDEVLRHVHSAISYAIPSAAVTGIRSLKSNAFDFTATIDAATASRYVLQAVFMATNNKGNKEAIESVHSAAWLLPGKSQLTFSLSRDIANKYKPPYYLASIKLVDYGQMKPVYEYNKPIDIRTLR